MRLYSVYTSLENTLVVLEPQRSGCPGFMPKM